MVGLPSRLSFLLTALIWRFHARSVSAHSFPVATKQDRVKRFWVLSLLSSMYPSKDETTKIPLSNPRGLNGLQSSRIGTYSRFSSTEIPAFRHSYADSIGLISQRYLCPYGKNDKISKGCNNLQARS